MYVTEPSGLQRVDERDQGDLEDYIASLPCICCGTREIVVAAFWFPTDGCLRADFGLEPADLPTKVLYPTCVGCLQRSMASPSFRVRVENRVIDFYRPHRRHDRQFFGRFQPSLN